MGGFFLGLFDLFLGLGLVFGGLRIFFAILPVGAFFVGGYAGAMAVHHFFDEGFLNTTASLLAGLACAIGAALVSYLLWYVGALIMAGSAGSLVGSGLMAAIGVDAGWLMAIVAAIFAVLAVIGAYVLNVPAMIVIVSTALTGAAISVLGALLVLNRVEVDDLENGPALAAVNHSWFWVIAWAALAGVGAWMQYTSAKEIELPEGRWARLRPETYARVGRTA